MRMIFFISICVFLFNSFSIVKGQEKSTIIVRVDSQVKESIVAVSTLIECNVINNTPDDIYMPKVLLMNDYKYKDIGPDQIGALVPRQGQDAPPRLPRSRAGRCVVARAVPPGTRCPLATTPRHARRLRVAPERGEPGA